MKERFLFYFGDEVGFLKVWDLTYLLENCKVERCKKTYAEYMKSSFNPSRIEGVDVSKLANSLRK